MAYPTGALPFEPDILNVTMTLADTEYSLQLPFRTKKFMIHTRDESAFRFAYETGRVAVPTGAIFTVPDNKSWWEDHVNLRPNDAAWDGTIYFASSDAGKIIEISYWLNEVP